MRRERTSVGKQKVLAVVDGSERTGRVLEHLLKLAANGLQMNVVVLNVQPAPEDWRLRGYISFKADEIWDRLVNDLGTPVVKGVARRLADAGIAHSEVVELGSFTESILKCQAEADCDWIVVSDRHPYALRRLALRLFGMSLSEACELAQLAKVPVVIVK